MKHFGLIGHPLGHSLSPQIHKRIMERAGIDGEYRLFDIAPENLDRELPALIRSLDGLNCTIPHKTAVIPHLARLADSASRVGAVNTIETKSRTGHNTDLKGFETTCGIDFRGKRVLLLGAGGTARALAASALANGAAAIIIATRNAMRDADGGVPYDDTRVAFMRLQSGTNFPKFDVLLNATPVGMWPNCGGIPIDAELLTPGIEVFDPIYNPVSTRLVLNARKRGARAVGGLRMLVRQAIEAQKIWNPEAVIDAEKNESEIVPHLIRELLAHYPFKILLTGFMGAGKSTAGKILAEKTGFAFADLDDEIVKRDGRAIHEIFASVGENGFREIERGVAETVFTAPESAIIASGGGFPTLPENRDLARAKNALVFDIAVPFEEAWRRVHSATNDTVRPLARERERAEALYDSREKIYRDFCDFQVRADALPEAVADAIVAALTM